MGEEEHSGDVLLCLAVVLQALTWNKRTSIGAGKPRSSNDQRLGSQPLLCC